MAAGKEIRNQISSIKSTQKITSAMEMVAASKMRRAQERMAASQPYAKLIRRVVGHVAKANPEYRHEYMVDREVKRVGYIVVSSDRGLAGGLNVNLFKAVVNHARDWDKKGVGADFAAIGSKAGGFFRKRGEHKTAPEDQPEQRAERCNQRMIDEIRREVVERLP